MNVRPSRWHLFVFYALLWLVKMSGITEAIRVIGGNRTAIRGQNVSLPCRITETDEVLSQVSWQKKTRENDVNHNFYIISSLGGPHSVNGRIYPRITFTGSLAAKDGSISLLEVRLLDEGLYTCLFTVFPSGLYKTEIPLTVLVPPVLKVEGQAVLVGEEEVTLVSCEAVGAKPPAKVRWQLTDSLRDSVKEVTNSTQHANGTATVVSRLVGVPTREVNHQSVQCVVNQPALETEKTLPITIEVHYSPVSVTFNQTSGSVFECASNANPKPSYNWRRVNQSWPSSDVRVGKGILEFLHLTPDLNGLYLCEATNTYGSSASSTLYLYVAQASIGCHPGVWTLLILLLIGGVGVAGVVMWRWYNHKKSSGREEGTPDRSQRAPEEVPLQPEAEVSERIEEAEEGTRYRRQRAPEEIPSVQSRETRGSEVRPPERGIRMGQLISDLHD